MTLRLMCVLTVFAVLAGQVPRPAVAGTARATATPIKHFVTLMQSNHSFDNYFGTYPGADGIPAGTCMRLRKDKPGTADCVRPFRLGDRSPDHLDHGPATQRAQYADGKMDGFVSAYRERGLDGAAAMGYYDANDLPYYWNVAEKYTLFDRFFSSATTGSRRNRFHWIAGVPTPGDSERVPPGGYGDIPTIFDRLEQAGVPWKFYVENFDPKITFRTPGTGPRTGQTTRVPLLNFARFLDDPALSGKIVDLTQYYADLRDGTLPAVAYVVASGSNENPPSRVRTGQAFVRGMIAGLAKSRYWPSSAFMWSYDSWGGWYDHVPPPKAGSGGLGFRVPALLVSAYSRRGHVDHTQLDHTAVPKFIEDNWRVAPLGERDARSAGITGAFDFTSPPRPPELVDTDRAAVPAPSRLASIVYFTYGGAVVLALLSGFGVAPIGRWLRNRRHSRKKDVR
ncbi:alkaline phosphatase family protein [Amycolatopsis decaplanina]|uniref:Phosphoesterase n=1 Tax=Amycolatopsis decaplanina DSM 44594 TaxID=1284240 RepID=M2YIS2_9PSEU|nr:alkaline phosphatase family protein [Amycolatopsis decaplanina]EME61680.1 phosphoesterase [Amycolatopsis decaplanina DSM 44594]